MIVAGITNIKIMMFDYVEKVVAFEEDLDVIGDIGSYLNVMEIVKKNSGPKEALDSSQKQEVFEIFLGTTEGGVHIFELAFDINYNNPVLAEFASELRALGPGGFQRNNDLDVASDHEDEEDLELDLD